METSDNILSWLVIAVILGGIFLGSSVVIKRFFIDKKYFGGSQFVGRQVYKALQNADRKESVEHVIYMEEDESLQDFTGEDKENSTESS